MSLIEQIHHLYIFKLNVFETRVHPMKCDIVALSDFLYLTLSCNITS